MYDYYLISPITLCYRKNIKNWFSSVRNVGGFGLQSRRQKHRTLHFGGNGGTSVKKFCLGVRNNILNIPFPTPCAKCAVLSALCLTKCPQNQFFANISQCMRPREKIVQTENVPRKISLQDEFLTSQPMRTYQTKNLFKWVEIEIFAFFHVFGYSFTNISRSIGPS